MRTAWALARTDLSVRLPPRDHMRPYRAGSTPPWAPAPPPGSPCSCRQIKTMAACNHCRLTGSSDMGLFEDPIPLCIDCVVCVCVVSSVLYQPSCSGGCCSAVLLRRVARTSMGSSSHCCASAAVK